MRCPRCGAGIVQEAPYCHECGARAAPEVAGAPDDTDAIRRALAAALGTQYEILRLLGRGGMGAVYLARETALERLVAIKVLPPHSTDAPESRDRFLREARTAARLTHQGVVPLLTFGESDGVAYYVMGYVEGESLETRLQRLGRLAPDEVRRILSEVAEALEYAHARGVVHRDIKPDNVLLDDATGRAILTDFGIAKRRTSAPSLTQVGVAVGTPQYMSPEQATGERAIDGRADIYALGVMGYRMLSGRLPFEGDNARELIVKHVTADAIPLSTIVPEAPLDLTEIIGRCLQKDPERRWADGKELKGALIAGMAGEDAYPENVMHLKGTGTLSVTLVAVTLVISVASMLGARSAHEAALIPAIVWYPLLGSLVPLAAGHVVHMMRRLRARGLTPRQAMQLLFWLPDWASGLVPWPARVRRRGDLWDRLPKEVRIASTLFTTSVLQLFPVAPLWLIGARTLSSAYWTRARQIAAGGYPWWLDAAIELAIPLCALSTFAAAVAVAFRWGRRNGLTVRETTQVVVAPTHGESVWSRPLFAKFLRPARETASYGPAEPKTAQEYLQAILTTADGLSGWQREVGVEAVATARHLIRTLESVDAEMAHLARDSDPAEVARLEQRLAAIAATPHRDSSDRHEMRDLLSSQLDLARRLAQRLDDTRARWSRLVELMRSLWLQLAELRAGAASHAAGAAGVTGEIRALCATIERRTAAEDEVERMLLGNASTRPATPV